MLYIKAIAIFSLYLTSYIYFNKFILFLQNSLMLNMNKIKLLNISRTLSVFPSDTIDPNNNVKNIGFIFDDNLNLFNQIANVCK